MPLHFTVLASGSSGNATLLEANGFGLLLDAGLGPRKLAGRLRAVGASWRSVHAVLLTHTHSDHWKERTLAHLCRQRIPFYCHPEHHSQLLTYGQSFAALQSAELVRGYASDVSFELAPSFRCQPLSLRHDGGATFGFRFELSSGPGCRGCAIGYVADLGSWSAALAEQLKDVDLLAVEFNHDVEMEYASGRSPYLIARVLGEHGHLSNDQASDLLREVLQRSPGGNLQHVVQLHLSRECNDPQLAAQAARDVLNGHTATVTLHTTSQEEPLPTIVLKADGPSAIVASSPAKRAGRARRSSSALQRFFPVMEE